MPSLQISAVPPDVLIGSDTRHFHTRRPFIGLIWQPAALLFHLRGRRANQLFFIRSTWQRSNTAVILAPSGNLDVYINYCYNQLTHRELQEKKRDCEGLFLLGFLVQIHTSWWRSYLAMLWFD